MIKFLIPVVLVSFIIGFVASISPSDLMFKHYVSPYHDVETTVDYIQYAATMEGWSTSGIGRVSNSIERDYPNWYGPEVVNVKYCKTTYSKEVVKTHPYLANLMPCKATVYECPEGVCVSVMNAGIMGKFFGLGSIMGEVQKDVDELMKLTKWFNGKIPKAQNRNRGKLLDDTGVQGYEDGC